MGPGENLRVSFSIRRVNLSSLWSIRTMLDGSRKATAEESASAAEQMSAQSRHMRSMVEELTELAAGGLKGNRRAAARPIQVSGSAIRKQLTAPSKKSRTPSARPAEKKSPEEIIPLEDDFTDFYTMDIQ